MHRRHPELSPKDVTVKLGKKWKSLGGEGQASNVAVSLLLLLVLCILQAKYKRRYEESQTLYKEKLQEFYSRYPEAEELLK